MIENDKGIEEAPIAAALARCNRPLQNWPSQPARAMFLS
jgi:hypothetical protein